MSEPAMNLGEMLIYQNPAGKVDARLEEESVWLTQAKIAQLFAKGRSSIVKHIKNIFSEAELIESVGCREFRHTTQHSAIEDKTKEYWIRNYNLDVIISVGYRVKFPQEIQCHIFNSQGKS